MSVEFFSLESLQSLAREYGYWAVFMGITLENMGIPLPGETITIIGGFLAGSGELNYWWVLAIATGGAVFGDNLGYWVGKVGGWPLLLRVGGFFRIQTPRLEQLRQKFAENAPRAVFFGRFVTLLRIFAGPLAGIAGMPYGQFFWCNLGGAATWASVMVSLAYFFGRIVPLATLVNRVALFGVLALLGIVGAIAIPAWLESRQT